jgi:hypothetical protein
VVISASAMPSCVNGESPGSLAVRRGWRAMWTTSRALILNSSSDSSNVRSPSVKDFEGPRCLEPGQAVAGSKLEGGEESVRAPGQPPSAAFGSGRARNRWPGALAGFTEVSRWLVPRCHLPPSRCSTSDSRVPLRSASGESFGMG